MPTPVDKERLNLPDVVHAATARVAPFGDLPLRSRVDSSLNLHLPTSVYLAQVRGTSGLPLSGQFTLDQLAKPKISSITPTEGFSASHFSCTVGEQ